MKDQNDNKTQDWCEVTMPLEVAQAALAAMRKVFIHWSVKPRGLARGYKRLILMLNYF